jgi:outer membrane cobalamin receptor
VPKWWQAATATPIPPNTVRLGGSALLNFYADYAVALGSTIFGRITNALDRRYELARLRHGGSP